MNPPATDPLLVAARIVLWAMIGICTFAAVMVAVIGAPALLIFRAEVIAGLAADGVPDPAILIVPLAAILLAVGALLGLAVWFLLVLLRIVRSVGEGDPFIPENAERLSQLGWIALAGQVALAPVSAAVAWIAYQVRDVPSIHVEGEVGISGEGILLVLVLFILARVFRHGAAMRADLEGTV